MNSHFPLITAHTGCENTPDNTLLSVETGLSSGADIIEEDVLVTRDGVAVLSHDDEITTMSGRKLRISQMNYEELAEQDIATNHNNIPTMRIMRLEDILPRIKDSGKMLNLDLKTDESIDPAAALIEKYGMLEQIILSGCEAERAEQVQRRHSQIRKLLNADVRLFQSIPYQDAVRKTCEAAVSAACIGINLHYRILQQHLIEEVQRLHIPLFVWTVNEEKDMKDCIHQGVRSITTRCVSKLLHLKQEVKNKHSNS